RSVCGSYPRPVRPLLGPGSGAEPVRVGGAHGGTAQRVAAADGVGRRPDRPARTGPGSRTAAQSHTHDPGRTRALLPRPPGGRPVPADRRCRDCVPATQVPPGCCLSVPPGPSGRDTPPQQTTTGAPMTQRVYYDDGTPPWTWWHTRDIDLDHTSAEVAHGYTLCSLDRLSRIAARRTFGGHISYTDRYWLAYSAMSEHLLAAEGPPTSRDLLRWRSTSWPVMATGIRRCRPTCPTWRSRERPRRNSGWCGRRARTSPGTAHPDR